LLGLPATAASASVNSSLDVSGRNERAAPASASSAAVADQLDTMLTARFAATVRIASVSERRHALEELRAFAAMTVEGLIGAAPSAQARTLIEEKLTALLIWHQDEIAAALAALPRAAREP
jgi:hypothetical protein